MARRESRISVTPAANLDTLTDTNLSSLADEDELYYDSGTGLWLNRQSNIDDRADVTISGKAEGDVLIWDATAGVWENHRSQDITSRADINTGQAQGGPTALWTPWFPNSLLKDDIGAFTVPAGATTVATGVGSTALPAATMDVTDASAWDASGYLAVEIGSVWRPVRYESISIGGGTGGSDRVTLSSAAQVGPLGAGHRGIGSFVAGDNVKVVYPKFGAVANGGRGSNEYLMVATISFESVAAGTGSFGVRYRSPAAPFYLPVITAYSAHGGVTGQAQQVVFVSGMNDQTMCEYYSTHDGATAGEIHLTVAGLGVPGVSATDAGVRP